jgi:predicted small lipoprotein YifL
MKPMMRRLGPALLSLLLLFVLLGCGKKEPPYLKVTVTQQGQNIVIKADTGSFKLGKDGHMHVRLDDGPEAMPRGDTYTIGNQKPGMHKIYVELADPDHNPLGISQTVQFELK